jgi:hypothetical protein
MSPLTDVLLMLLRLCSLRPLGSPVRVLPAVRWKSSNPGPLVPFWVPKKQHDLLLSPRHALRVAPHRSGLPASAARWVRTSCRSATLTLAIRPVQGHDLVESRLTCDFACRSSAPVHCVPHRPAGHPRPDAEADLSGPPDNALKRVVAAGRERLHRPSTCASPHGRA